MTLSSGGIARYAAELSLALAENFPEDEFTLMSDQAFSCPPGSPSNLTTGRRAGNWLERRWWSWGIAREMARVGADLFHGTNFEVPLLPGRPAVMTLHDLSPWMDPSWHHAADRVRSRTPFLIGLGLASTVITPTEAVRRQAIERFRIHPARVAAVPHGGLSRVARSSPPASAPVAAPYFLYVGTLEPRKNIECVVEAWRQVRADTAVSLVLAGRRRADFVEMQPEPGLQVLGEVAEEALVGLYSNAVALVYFSKYEGFGLPVLEAMQCGACVITSNDPALTEVAGEAAIRAESIRDLIEVMSFALERPEWTQEWRGKALRRGREYSWERTARMTRAIYGEARNRS